MEPEIRMKFYGIRALHAAPSTSNVLYGGNSSCIVIEDQDNVFIVNAGFGVCGFGDEYVARNHLTKKPTHCHLFLNDFMWENIMGFPFFLPIHFRSTKIHVHTPVDEAATQEWLTHICSQDFSPFHGLRSFRSTLNFEPVVSRQTIGAWTIDRVLSPHPFAPYPCASWIFEHEGGFRVGFSSFVPQEKKSRKAYVKVFKNCHALVQAAIAPQITHPTMAGRMTFSEALDFGVETGAEHVYLHGVHPMLSDRDLMHAEVELARAKGRTSGVHFSIAREWATIGLPMMGVHHKAG